MCVLSVQRAGASIYRAGSVSRQAKYLAGRLPPEAERKRVLQPLVLAKDQTSPRVKCS
jgi:hypothetical protein